MARETETETTPEPKPEPPKPEPMALPCPACGGAGGVVERGRACASCNGTGRATLKLYHVHAFKFPTAWAMREIKATSPQEAFEKATAEGADPDWSDDDFEVGSDWPAPEFFRVTDPDSDEETEFERDPVKLDNERLRAFLTEIAKGRGAYSMDPLRHADNCIENMKALAEKALAGEPATAKAEG